MKITHKISMDLDRYAVPGFDAVCGDRNTRELEIALYAGGTEWVIPEGTSVSVRYRKPDGTGGSYDLLPNGTTAWETSGNTVTVVMAPQTMTVPGCVILTVCLAAGDREISTFQILMNVRPAAGWEPADSGDYWYRSDSLPQPEKAQVGQVLVVRSVDSHGRVTGVTTAAPGAGLTIGQIRALEALLKLVAYTEDPSGAWQAFENAFAQSPEAVPAESIRLSVTFFKAGTVGAMKQLTVTLTPENTTDKVIWTTSDPAVATVEDGLVTVIGRGECTVTATAGRVSASCTVRAIIGEPVEHTHSYIATVTTPATCDTPGVRTYTCLCGDSYTEAIPAAGHDYANGVCRNCGAADPDYEEPVVMTGISAVYSGGDVTVGTAVDDLVGIAVTAHYSDGTSTPVTGYTLSGTIAEGNNTITVSYGGMSTTFAVTGYVEVVDTRTVLYNWDFTRSMVDTVNGAEATLSGAIRDGNGVTIDDGSESVFLGNFWRTNRTIEVDFGSFTPNITATHVLVMFGSSNGFSRWANGDTWGVYCNGTWNAPDPKISDRNYFANATLKLKVAEDGAISVYRNHEWMMTSTQTFATADAPIHIGKVIGSSYGSVQPITVTGCRIYEGVE